MAFTKPDLSRVWANGAVAADIEDPDVTTPGKVDAGWQIEIPTYQHFNFLQNWFSQGLAYFNENSHAEWDALSTYPIGSVIRGANPRTTFRALIQNTNVQPETDVGGNWIGESTVDTYSDIAALQLPLGSKIHTLAHITPVDGLSATFTVAASAGSDSLDGFKNIALVGGNVARKFDAISAAVGQAGAGAIAIGQTKHLLMDVGDYRSNEVIDPTITSPQFHFYDSNTSIEARFESGGFNMDLKVAVPVEGECIHSYDVSGTTLWVAGVDNGFNGSGNGGFATSQAYRIHFGDEIASSPSTLTLLPNGTLQVNRIDAGIVSSTTSGYTTLPNGMMLIWGTAIVPINVSTLIPFPISFPTATRQVIVCTGDSTNLNNAVTKERVDLRTNSSITIYLHHFGGGGVPLAVQYFAIGE